MPGAAAFAARGWPGLAGLLPGVGRGLISIIAHLPAWPTWPPAFANQEPGRGAHTGCSVVYLAAAFYYYFSLTRERRTTRAMHGNR